MAFSSRILLVDDEPFFRSVLKAFLKKIGFAIEEADNVDDALLKLRKFDPEIVLLDIVMPGKSWKEMLEATKKWKPACQVIMVTGMPSEETRTECLSKGAFAVIHKPVELEDLRATVLAAIEESRAVS